VEIVIERDGRNRWKGSAAEGLITVSEFGAGLLLHRKQVLSDGFGPPPFPSLTNPAFQTVKGGITTMIGRARLRE
jgi:hypothetical protein